MRKECAAPKSGTFGPAGKGAVKPCGYPDKHPMWETNTVKLQKQREIGGENYMNTFIISRHKVRFCKGYLGTQTGVHLLRSKMTPELRIDVFGDRYIDVFRDRYI